MYGSPSAAATEIAGHGRNGWQFFVVDEERKRRLAHLHREYVSQMSVEGVEDEEALEDDDEDA